MPWHIKKIGNKYCVAKKSTGKCTGSKRYNSRDAAKPYLRALYANENVHEAIDPIFGKFKKYKEGDSLVITASSGQQIKLGPKKTAFRGGGLGPFGSPYREEVGRIVYYRNNENDDWHVYDSHASYTNNLSFLFSKVFGKIEQPNKLNLKGSEVKENKTNNLKFNQTDSFNKKVKEIQNIALQKWPKLKEGINEWADELLHGFSWDDGYRQMKDMDWLIDCKKYALETMNKEEQFYQGDLVRIIGKVEGKGQFGRVKEVAPSGKFIWVKLKNGSVHSYHNSDITSHDDEGDEKNEFEFSSEKTSLNENFDVVAESYTSYLENSKPGYWYELVNPPYWYNSHRRHKKTIALPPRHITGRLLENVEDQYIRVENRIPMEYLIKYGLIPTDTIFEKSSRENLIQGEKIDRWRRFLKKAGLNPDMWNYDPSENKAYLVKPIKSYE